MTKKIFITPRTEALQIQASGVIASSAQPVIPIYDDEISDPYKIW